MVLTGFNQPVKTGLVLTTSTLKASFLLVFLEMLRRLFRKKLLEYLPDIETRECKTQET